MTNQITQLIEYEGRRQTTISRMPSPFINVITGLWLFTVISGLILVIIGTPMRVDQITAPCEPGACTGPQQFEPVHHEIVAEWGWKSTENYIWVTTELFAMLLTVGSVIPAAIIYLRRRDSWIALVASLFLVTVAYSAPGNITAIARAYPAFQPVSVFFSVLTAIIIFLMFYTFPNGHFVPGWTRWLAVAWGIWAIFSRSFPNVVSSVDPNFQRYIDILVYSGGAIAQVYRYVKVATPVERQQTKWGVISIGIQVFTFVVYMVITLIIQPDQNNPVAGLIFGAGLWWIYVLTFLLIPVALFFSILKYRLWDIDFIINRSLVYGTVTVVLGAVFVGGFLLIRALLQSILGSEQTLISMIIPAVLVMVLFSPTRDRFRRFVDKQLYGIGLDYIEAIKEYAEQAQAVVRAHKERVTRSFGKYLDLTLIGRGGMGEVYKAVLPDYPDPVAVKILPFELIDDPDARARFMREAQAIQSLDHPNIIKMHEVGELEETPYIAMEYINGTDLSELLKEMRLLDQNQVIGILRDLASALDYAHNQGIIHRDIKPSNMMIETGSGRAVLMDFGIARVSNLTQMTETGGMIGTLDYISPEQIQATGNVDHRADIYALGVMAYELLTGELPFKHNNPGAMVLAHLMQPAPDPRSIQSNIPPQTASAILQAMSKKPDDRFDSAGAMVAALTGHTA